MFTNFLITLHKKFRQIAIVTTLHLNVFLYPFDAPVYTGEVTRYKENDAIHLEFIVWKFQITLWLDDKKRDANNKNHETIVHYIHVP